MAKRRNQLHEFRSENGASLRRITLSTHVGRLSRSHSDIGFSVNSISRGKGWLNGKVKGPIT